MRRRRRRESRWEGAASAPQERRRERERDWSRRHEASSLLGDERHLSHTEQSDLTWCRNVFWYVNEAFYYYYCCFTLVF